MINHDSILKEVGSYDDILKEFMLSQGNAYQALQHRIDKYYNGELTEQLACRVELTQGTAFEEYSDALAHPVIDLIANFIVHKTIRATLNDDNAAMTLHTRYLMEYMNLCKSAFAMEEFKGQTTIDRDILHKALPRLAEVNDILTLLKKEFPVIDAEYDKVRDGKLRT